MTVRRRCLRAIVLAGLAALLRPEMTADRLAASAIAPGLVFHTVSPCRLVDTRAAGAGGPLVAGVDRTFTIVDACGVPVTARAVSLNLAVTQPTTSGNVRLYPADAPVPTVSAVNYAAGQTRSNNAVVGLSATGELKALSQPAGSVHLILDVNGYFQSPSCEALPPGTTASTMAVQDAGDPVAPGGSISYTIDVQTAAETGYMGRFEVNVPNQTTLRSFSPPTPSWFVEISSGYITATNQFGFQGFQRFTLVVDVISTATGTIDLSPHLEFTSTGIGGETDVTCDATARTTVTP